MSSIGDGCRLLSHVHITGHTTIGRAHRDLSVRVARHAAAIGQVSRRADQARHRRGLRDPRKRHHEYRHRRRWRRSPSVGDKCLFMVGSHVGHDCKVGNNVTMANNAVLGGHCLVEDYVVFGGHSAVHQFVRIGESAMIAGMTGIGADVIPFGFAIGQRGDARRPQCRRHAPSRLFALRHPRSAAGLSRLFLMRGPSQGSHRGGRARIRVRSGGREDRRIHPRRRVAAADESMADGAGRRTPRRTAQRHERRCPAGRDRAGRDHLRRRQLSLSRSPMR